MIVVASEQASAPKLSSGLARGAMIAVSVVYLLLAMHTPIGVNTNAPHDDGLFMGHALSVLNGGWFGPYDQLTLAKGQGYTFALLAGYFAGLPVTFTHALLYLLGALCVTLAVGRLTHAAWFTLLLYVVLLLHPATQLPRVTRDAIYASQALLICGASFFLMMACRRDRFRGWLAACAGLLVGWFWLTKEEGMWLVPGLAVLFLGTGWLHRRRGGSIRALIQTSAVLVAVAITGILAYAGVNMHEYGKFVGVDFKETNFESAVAALQGVRVGDTVPNVPVPKRVRNTIYEVSPSFAELKGALDGNSPASGWSALSCQAYPATCGDIAGAWFVWALRDAVASKGYYRTPAAASAYYQRLTSEIEAACDSARLSCNASLLPLMPRITSTQLFTIPAKVGETIELLTFIKRAPVLDAEPSRTTAQVDALLGRPLQMPQRATDGVTYKMAGWYHAKGAEWFRLRCEDGDDANVTVRRLASPDVAKVLADPGAERQRFEMTVKTDPACPLQLQGVGKHAFNLAEMVGGRKAFAFGEETLFIDAYEVVGSKPLVDRPAEWVRSLRQGIRSVYAVLLPTLAGLGLIAYVAEFVLIAARRRPVTLQFVFSTSLWTLLVTRIGVVVLVDVSSFSAIDRLYLMPAYPLLCLAALLSVYGWFPARPGKPT
ncbi:MAG: hypothetical protein ABI981_08085 [Betaproteobacteria bacterium]